MFKKGLAVAVILLFIGLALTPTTYGDFDKPDIEVIEEDVTPTPIVLVLQLMTKLRNHKDIQNVESEDDVLKIIEGDEKLNNIFELLSVEDCGCEDEILPLEWGFPVICVLLVPWLAFALMLLLMGGYNLLGQIVGTIGLALNCWWTQF